MYQTLHQIMLGYTHMDIFKYFKLLIKKSKILIYYIKLINWFMDIILIVWCMMSPFLLMPMKKKKKRKKEKKMMQSYRKTKNS